MMPGTSCHFRMMRVTIAQSAAGETLSRDDWRRQNVDRLIERMYEEVKRAKPWVLVGISPFGIWRPGHPEGIAGLDQYATLYADARKWQHEGWLDYLTPQLYWQIDSEGQSYPKLLAWWHEQNHKAAAPLAGQFHVESPPATWHAGVARCLVGRRDSAAD